MYRYLPLSQVSSTHDLTNIRLVATDMDGTLTTDGKFTAALLQALEDLTAHGIKVLIVTGRSAGWGKWIGELPASSRGHCRKRQFVLPLWK